MDNEPQQTYREGGWGWAVVLSAFFAHFIGYGTVKALGVLISDMSHDLATDIWIIGCINSLHIGVQFGLVPVAAAVARKIGLRFVVTFGGVLYGAGLILATVSLNVTVLAISIVVLAGCGSACVMEMTRAAIMYYFHEKYSLANSIACMGDPSGMMVYGPVAQLLLETYGWRGVMLLLGGVGCHLIVFGLLVKPPAKSYSRVSNPVVINPTEKVPGETARPPSKQTRRTLRSILSSVGLDFLMDTEFFIITISRVLVNVVYITTIVYVVPNALILGLTPTEASFLTTAWGVGQIAGYLVSTFLFGWKRLSKSAISAGTLVSAVCLGANPFITSFAGQMVDIFVIGMGTSIACVLTAVLTRELPIADDKLFVVFCWQSSLTGLVALLGGVISGWLYDVTGSFQATFLWCGGCVLVSILLVFVHFVYISKRDRQPR